MEQEQTMTADIGAESDGDAFAAFILVVGQLQRNARKRAEGRGEHGRRWALVATKLEEAHMHAERGYRESE